MRDAGVSKEGADLESGEAPASPEDVVRRKELAGFLRTRRTRLAPEAQWRAISDGAVKKMKVRLTGGAKCETLG